MRQLIFFILLTIAPVVSSEEPVIPVEMTQQQLHDVILEIGSDVLVSGNVVQFSFGGADLLCISDVAADRMRIVSPIVEVAQVDPEQLMLALVANFHSALDTRYAISDGVVYSAYIHPLSPLSGEELISGIHQVASARNTFGVEYSSGKLFFGGGDAQQGGGDQIPL